MTLPSLKQTVQAMYQTLCPALWEGDVLLRWAVSTSLLVLAVLALRLTLGRGLSCRWRYALWAVVLVRALLPLHLPLALPLSSAQVPSPTPRCCRRPAPFWGAPGIFWGRRTPGTGRRSPSPPTA